MTARFMRGTPYAALEIEMQRPPGFRPRKSGMIISRCVCGTQECDCSLCAHKERNGIDQMEKDAPAFVSRFWQAVRLFPS